MVDIQVAHAGVPGYVNQETYTTEQEGVGDEAPGAEESTELTPEGRAASPSRLELRQQGRLHGPPPNHTFFGQNLTYCPQADPKGSSCRATSVGPHQLTCSCWHAHHTCGLREHSCTTYLSAGGSTLQAGCPAKRHVSAAGAGVPGYVNQESFRTAREELTGDEAPEGEEPIEHTPATEEPTQAPPGAEPASTAEGPQAETEEGDQDEHQQHAAEAGHGAGEWPDVTLSGDSPL